MSEPPALSASIDGLNRMLSDTLGPELQRQEAAIEEFLRYAQQARERLHATIERTEEELTAPFDAADEGLRQIEGLLDGLVVPALEQATSPTAELFLGESAKASASVEDARHHFESIHTALADAQQASESATSKAERGVAELNQQVEASCRKLQETVQMVSGRLDSTKELVETGVSSIEGGLDELRKLVEQRLEALQSLVNESMQQSDVAVAQMHEDTRRALDDLCGNAKEILESLSAAAQKISELFDGEVDEILDKVEYLLKVIEQIRPLLEIVEQWT
jgi:uncharacterized phage infection (PIP) family protein YhgE